MSNSNDTTIFENDIVICTGTSDSLTITNHDSMASTTSISTDSFTITDGDYVFNLAANDTVRVYCNAGEMYVSGTTTNSFSCHLLG